MREIKSVGWIFAWLSALFCATWATGALFFDFPVVTLRAPAAIVFVLVLIVSVIRLPGRLLKLTNGIALIDHDVNLGNAHGAALADHGHGPGHQQLHH
jgi:hypothetical protein